MRSPARACPTVSTGSCDRSKRSLPRHWMICAPPGSLKCVSTRRAQNRTTILPSSRSKWNERQLRAAFLSASAYVGTNVFGALYTIQALLAMLVRQIKPRADALFEQPVDSVVMGRPVFFSTDPQKDALAQSRLHTAARGAGFQHIHFL